MSGKNFVSKSYKLILNIAYVTRKNYGASAGKRGIWSADNIVTSSINNVKIPNTTIVNYIWEKLEKWPHKTAVVCGLTNESYTYQQLQKYSRTFAANLRSHFQIIDGDIICAMMSNCPQYCVAVLGTLEAGAIITTMNPIYTSHEIHRQLLLSTPKIIIGSSDTVEVIKAALKLSKMDMPIIVVKKIADGLPAETIDFDALAVNSDIDASILKKVSRKIDDVALLPYSSGTTGLQKGVELMNKNLVANFVQTDGLQYFIETTESRQDSVLSVLPFYHIYGLAKVMLYHLTLGSKLVTLPNFRPATFLNALKDHKISMLPTVPPMVLFLGSHPAATAEHLQHVHTMICGAAPLPKTDIERLFVKTNAKMNFSQIYGLTETSPLVTVSDPNAGNYSVAGLPIPLTELKIIGPNEAAVGPDQIGELLIRGPQIMKGYKKNPEATKTSVDTEGWFRSGDLGSLSKDGILTIHDRLKELIKVKGYQVPPAELESVLKEHPDVHDAAVLGIPDRRMGEVPKAFVVLKNNRKPNPVNIMNFVKERVAEYKRLKEIIFVDDLPRNDAGKILKRVLKDQYV